MSDKVEDERDRFEAWFKGAYGPRPFEDNVLELAQQVFVLRQKIEVLTDYDAHYQGAMAAWHEKHGRDQKPAAPIHAAPHQRTTQNPEEHDHMED